jgi:hypothetical protein
LFKRGHVGRPGCWLGFTFLTVCSCFGERTETTGSIIALGVDKTTS